MAYVRVQKTGRKKIVTLVCVVVDTSASMFHKNENGESSMYRLNRGLNYLIDDLNEKTTEKDEFEVAIVEFGNDAKTYQGQRFLEVGELKRKYGKIEIKAAQVHGDMPVGVKLGLEIINERMAALSRDGIKKRTPRLVIMSDGRPYNPGTDIGARLKKMQKLTSENERLRVVPVFIIDPGSSQNDIRERSCITLAKFRTGPDEEIDISVANENCVRIDKGNDEFEKFFATFSNSVSEDADIFEKHRQNNGAMQNDDDENNEDENDAPIENIPQILDGVLDEQAEEPLELNLESVVAYEAPVVEDTIEYEAQENDVDYDEQAKGTEVAFDVYEEELDEIEQEEDIAPLEENYLRSISMPIDSLVKPCEDDPEDWDDI